MTVMSTAHHRLQNNPAESTDQIRVESRLGRLLHHLPTELVGDIFIHVFQDSKGNKNSPLLLCAVCKKWRAVAVSTPRLWTDVTVRFKEPLADGYECVLLQQWFDRTGACPLALNLAYRVYQRGHKELDTADIDSRIRRMTNIISTILHKCQTIHANLSTKSRLYLDPTLSFTTGMPLLEEFYLESSHNRSIDLRACPNLRTFKTTRMAHPYRLTRFGDCQHHSLRCLTTSGSWNDLYQAFARFSSLTECDIHALSFADESANTPTEMQRLILPRLQSLSIYLDVLNAINPLLDSLCVLALKQFHLFDSEEQRFLPYWASLHSMFQRSRPPLESLDLYLASPIPEHELIELLSWMPTLKSLQLDFPIDTGLGVITVGFWGALSGIRIFDQEGSRPNTDGLAASTQPPICPRLEDLRIHPWHPDVDLAIIATTILSRFPSCCHGSFNPRSDILPTESKSLRTMIVSGCHFTKDEFLLYPGMDEYVRAGLKVNLYKMGGSSSGRLGRFIVPDGDE